MKSANPFKVFHKSIIGLALTLVMVVPLLGYPASAKENEPIQVELDIFSGRENPYWELTPQEASQFARLLETLPESKGESSVREGLGYRGLIVTQAGKSIAGYDEILISNGLVVARKGNESRLFIDKDRLLEQWLFQTAKGRLEDSLYQQVSPVISH